jgi:hypothetical protein
MVTKTRKRKFAGSKKRFIGKPTGQIHAQRRRFDIPATV